MVDGLLPDVKSLTVITSLSQQTVAVAEFGLLAIRDSLENAPTFDLGVVSK
jgi:hypothetical protein